MLVQWYFVTLRTFHIVQALNVRLTNSRKSHGAIMRSLGYVKYPTETCRNVSGKLLPVFWGVIRQEKYVSNIYKSIEQSPPWEADSSLSSQEFSSQETTSCPYPASDVSRCIPVSLRYILVLSSHLCVQLYAIHISLSNMVW